MPERKPKSELDRRRPTRQQGEALEILGHAIEYLIDSRPFLPVELGGEDHKETLDLLKCQSQQVFAECAAVVSTRDYLKHWLGRILRY